MAKNQPVASAASRRAAKRARALIEQMLLAMKRGLDDPGYLDSEAWEKLFGAKQSMVANLQKLVAALAALPDEPARQEADGAGAAQGNLTPQEMALLKAWLEEGE